MGLIAREVLRRDQAALRAHLLLDQGGGLAGVEPGGAVLRDALEGPGQVGLLEDVPRGIGGAVLRELCERRGVAAELGQIVLEVARQAVGDHEAVTGEGDGGLDQAAPGELAVLLPGEVQPRHGARHSHGQVAVVVPVGVVVAVLVQEHLGMGSRGCYLAEVVGVRLAVFRAEQEESAPADVARGGVGDGQGERGGDRGIHRAAAVGERPAADLRGQRDLAHHHALAGAHGLSGPGPERGRRPRQDQNGQCFFKDDLPR